MSGRIRTIKPELLEDAVTAGLSDSAFRVFIGMILLADDYGNVRAEPKYLEGQIYWSAIPETSVRLSRDSLETLITIYTVRGQTYAHINGWSKHQRVQHPGKPRVPGIEDRDDGDIPESLVRVSGEPHESLAPDLRPPTSDHDPEQSRARETLTARSLTLHPDPEVQKLIAAIESEPKLLAIAPSDVRAVAVWAMPVGKRKPLADLLGAIQDAVLDTPEGELAHLTQKRLRTYLGAAKPKRKDPDAPSTVPYHRVTREEPPSGIHRSAAEVAELAAKVAGIGRGR